jgi:hypothetical protein
VHLSCIGLFYQMWSSGWQSSLVHGRLRVKKNLPLRLAILTEIFLCFYPSQQINQWDIIFRYAMTITVDKAVLKMPNQSVNTILCESFHFI